MQAYEELRQAERMAHFAIEQDYPVGTTILYKTGMRRVPATVLLHGFGLRLKVRGRHGHEYWINAIRLLP
jgi:hypothetical protein